MRRCPGSRGWLSALAGWLLLSLFAFPINLMIGETGIDVMHVRRIEHF